MKPMFPRPAHDAPPATPPPQAQKGCSWPWLHSEIPGGASETSEAPLDL